MFFASFQAYGQQISGTVMSNGEPIPGVNIINITNGKGTLTDFDGNFTLDEVSEGDEVEFSYLGFKNQIIVYNGQTDITSHSRNPAKNLMR